MSENIDWVTVRKERREKIISVSQDAIESYVLISELPDVSFVDTWDMPEDWMASGVHYDASRGSFLFLILSPEFESVKPGQEAESLFAYRHIVKLTREIEE